jgi:mannose-6-phosphate isomerase-like protein (cupin superfamily)
MQAMTKVPMTPIVLEWADIIDLAHHELEGAPGTEHRVLWTDGVSSAGVLTIAPGHRLGRHTHRRHHHHVWVVEGHATILESDVGPGSYVHVPAGVAHDFDATTSEGCTVFYLYMHDGEPR